MAIAATLPLRALKILGIALAAFLILLLLLAILLVLFIRSDALEAQVREHVLPRISDRLGREVSVEALEAHILPSPFVRIGGLRVGGRSAIPLLETETIEARLRVWPLLRSRGRHMVLDHLNFDTMRANLVRLPSGAWDIPRPPPSERKIDLDLEDIALTRGMVRVMNSRGEVLVEVQDVSARANYVDGALAFDTLLAEAYGATIDAGGSRIDLGAEPMQWRLDTEVEDLLLQSLPTKREALLGELALVLDLEGEDVDPERMRGTASGIGRLDANDLVWRTFDLSDAIAQSLRGILGKAGLPIDPPLSSGQTRLGSWERSMRVQNGWVAFEEPLEVDSPVGKSRFGGRWSLDARLDIEAVSFLEEEYVRTITRGELRPDEPIPLRYRIRGSFAQPRIEDLDVSAFLPFLAEEGARRLREGLERLLPPFGTGTPPP